MESVPEFLFVRNGLLSLIKWPPACESENHLAERKRPEALRRQMSPLSVHYWGRKTCISITHRILQQNRAVVHV